MEKNLGISYTVNSIHKILERTGYSFTCPTYILAKADLKKQAAFIEEFEKIKWDLFDGKIDRIFFLDESMIRDYQAIQKTWFKKGKQKLIKTYGKHRGAKLIGALDYESGEIFCTVEEQYTAKEFLIFLELLVAKCDGEKIVVVLDNARIHHAKLLKSFLKENEENLVLKFLPPYSPNLNLIEGLWKWMKSSVINNVFFETVEEIRTAVTKFIQQRNLDPESVIERLCLKL
jgi:transposase